MQRTKEIELDGGRRITVRELTVAELRNWLKDLENAKDKTIDLVTEGIIPDASLTDVSRMIDLTLEDLDALTPTQIAGMVAVCKELNPHFFQLRDRLMVAARSIQQ